MGAYILRRLLLMIPTIFGIMAISFIVVQFAPGGPVEQVISDLTNAGGSDRLSGSSGDLMQAGGDEGGRYRGAQGLDPEFIAKLEKQFGFDKPPLERFATMMWNYMRFDFGESFFRNTSVIDLIKEKMPVSISLGLWILLFSYAISIPLGIKKAVSDGSAFDVWTSGIIVVGCSGSEWILRGPSPYDALTIGNLRPIPDKQEGSAPHRHKVCQKTSDDDYSDEFYTEADVVRHEIASARN